MGVWKKLLQEEAWKVGNLLDEHLAIHDKVLKEAGTLRSLFQRIDYENLFHDSYEVSLMIKRQEEHLINIKRQKYQELTDNEKVYFDLLISYTSALANAADILTDEQRKSLDISEDRKINKRTWREFRYHRKKYKEAVQEYRNIGRQLMEKAQIIFS